MNAKNIMQDRLRFAEEMGILMERNGHPRISGKILGYLLIADEPYTSGEDLAQALRASKGSISTMTRFLLQLGLIEKVGVPADRRDFFRIRRGSFSSLLRSRMTQVTEFKQILEKGLALVPEKTSEAHRHLEAFHQFYDFFEKEFAALLARWEELQVNEVRHKEEMNR